MTLEEFNKSADLYSDNLYRFVLKNLRDEDLAQDTVQEAYEKLWLKHQDIDFGKSKPYLFACAYHSLIDVVRKKRNCFLTCDEAAVNIPQKHFSQFSGIKEALNEALNQLPAEQKSVILLRDYEGYSYDEISQITGMTLASVKVYIFRGRVAMKKKLELLGLTVNDLED
ncbi:MAG: RNA polymerase sigma factor [Bacteroidales bacterium]|nr:RNA polymerase sigma factor [Bacteroidales bacterium]